MLGGGIRYYLSTAAARPLGPNETQLVAVAGSSQVELEADIAVAVAGSGPEL